MSNESIVGSWFNFVASLIVCSIMWPSPIVLVWFGYEQAQLQNRTKVQIGAERRCLQLYIKNRADPRYTAQNISLHLT